ncbi:sulfatase-like hydrolase/transferase [Paenibacillus cymbidii]|uniref:sulfatase-like hydrolase/transferase n=1 Tax=Paenibacillus cymbidii TaxID=1639034 RepID=UPI00108162D1|nr:sulfatase-like hydrolase/transferase [Paenibacillus cymbidii]
MPHQPNIVILFTDDQRFDTIHTLGNRAVRTPNMDRLVAGGAAFTQAHIPGGTSAAICMPSRAMLHSGRTLFHLQGSGQQIPPEHTTLGEAFRQAGYRTFGTGKWHNGPAAYARSFTDGEAIFFGGMWDHWSVPLCHYDVTGRYDNKVPYTPDFQHSNHPMQVHCDYYSTGKHSSEIISDAAVDFINGHDGRQPFLMYVSYLAPHDPRTMPERFRTMYDPADIELPANFMPEHPFRFGVEEIRDELLAGYPRTEDEIKRHIADYYAMLSHLDEQIGRVLAALEQTGRADDTIVVLAGDNGLAVGQHGLMGKQNHYEHSIRVPLVIAGPGVPAGLAVDRYAYLLDLFPTLCELAGVAIPASVEGASLRPLMEQPDTRLRETLYFAYNDLIRSVKDERFKLIEYAGGCRQTQLFDLAEDPLELTNLYGRPEYESNVRRLRQLLVAFRDEWDDAAHPLGQAYWASYDASERS